MKPLQNLNIQVGVKSFLINQEGLILVIKRACYPEYTWELPGGRIGSRETLLKALKREIVEETNIKSIRDSKLLTAQDIFPVKDLNTHVVRLTYISRVTSSKVTLSEEHSEYQWLTLKEISKLKHLDQYLKEILKDKELMSFIKDISLQVK